MTNTYIQQRFKQVRSYYNDLYESNVKTLARNLLYRIWLFPSIPSYSDGNYAVYPYSNADLPDQLLPTTTDVERKAQSETILDIYKAIIDIDLALYHMINPRSSTEFGYDVYSLIGYAGEVTLDSTVPQSLSIIKPKVDDLYKRSIYLYNSIGDVGLSDYESTECSTDDYFCANVVTKYMQTDTTVHFTIYEHTGDFAVGDVITIAPYSAGGEDEFFILGYPAGVGGAEILNVIDLAGITVDTWAAVGDGSFSTTVLTVDVVDQRSITVEIPKVVIYPEIASATIDISIVITPVSGADESIIILPIAQTSLTTDDRYANIGNIYRKLAVSECNIDGYSDNVTNPYLLETINLLLFNSSSVGIYPTPPLPLVNIFRLLISKDDDIDNDRKFRATDLDSECSVYFIYELLFGPLTPMSMSMEYITGLMNYPSVVHDPYRDGYTDLATILERGFISRNLNNTYGYVDFYATRNSGTPTGNPERVNERLSEMITISPTISMIEAYEEISSDTDFITTATEGIDESYTLARTNAVPIGQISGIANSIGCVPPALTTKLTELKDAMHKVVQLSSISGVNDSDNTTSAYECYTMLNDLANKIGATKFGITQDDLKSFAASNHSSRILKLFRDILSIMSLKDAVNNIVNNNQFKGINIIAAGGSAADCLIDIPAGDARSPKNTYIDIGDEFNAHTNIYPYALVPYSFFIGPLDKSSTEDGIDSVSWTIPYKSMSQLIDVMNDIAVVSWASRTVEITIPSTAADIFKKDDGIAGYWIRTMGNTTTRQNYFITSYLYDDATGVGTLVYINGTENLGAATLDVVSINSGQFTIQWNGNHYHLGEENPLEDVGTWSSYSWCAIRSDIVGATHIGVAYDGSYIEPPTDNDILNIL